MVKFSRYQWTVLAAAWLGWGFDVFDGLLFNYVAPNAVPTLLGLPLGSPEARSATLYWTGLLTSLFLIGWAVGGVIFGPISDRSEWGWPLWSDNVKSGTREPTCGPSVCTFGMAGACAAPETAVNATPTTTSATTRCVRRFPAVFMVLGLWLIVDA